MLPPGNLPAHAREIAKSFAKPICAASHALENGIDGFIKARRVKDVGRPCLVADIAVLYPSITD